MFPIHSQSTLGTFLTVAAYLQAKERRSLFLFFLSALVLAALETMTVASIAIFATAIADPDSIFQSRYFSSCFELFPFLKPVGQQQLIYTVSGIMVALLLAKNAYRVLQSYHFTKFTGDLENSFGEKILKGFLSLPYEWHLSKNSADLQYTMYARTNIGRGFAEAWLQLGTECIMVAMLLAALLLDQPLLSMGVLGFCGIISFIILTINKPILDRTAKAALADRMAINSHATKAIHGIKDILLLRKETNILTTFVRCAQPLSRHTALQKALSLAPGSLLETFGFLAMSVFVWFLMDKDGATTGTVLASVTLLAVAAWRILPAMSRILNNVTMIRNSLPDVHHVLAFLQTVEDKGKKLDRKSTTLDHRLFRSRLGLDAVSFSYDKAAHPSLKNVSFQVQKNQTIGIIGRSGAGKSTLVDVLVGFFKPSAGCIRIDDEPLTDDLSPAWLSKLGYVPQFPYICHGTLAENVAFGDPPENIDASRVHRCCEMANIDFLDELPAGIDTFIGERGVKLSGGQLQRVAIARALYPNPEVIIFDEATSALDRHSEQVILQTILDLSRNHTVLIIAHNMETVLKCDKIIWLESGAIVAQGTPETIIPQYQKYQSSHNNAEDQHC